MTRARAVILCPSHQGWTWWEVCQVRKLCEPERVLFALPRRHSGYLWNQLRARLEGEMNISLPSSFRTIEVLGIPIPIPRRKASFYRFDRAWNAIPVNIVFRPWLLRPFLFHHMSVSTFKPFMEQPARIPPREGADPLDAAPLRAPKDS